MHTQGPPPRNCGHSHSQPSDSCCRIPEGGGGESRKSTGVPCRGRSTRGNFFSFLFLPHSVGEREKKKLSSVLLFRFPRSRSDTSSRDCVLLFSVVFGPPRLRRGGERTYSTGRKSRPDGSALNTDCLLWSVSARDVFSIRGTHAYVLLCFVH